MKFYFHIKQSVCGWICQHKGQLLFAVWTFSYWLAILLLCITIMDDADYKETLMFILSWPAVLFTFVPISLDSLFFIITIPVFVFVFTKYWWVLLNLFSRGKIGIFIGIACHLLGGLILVERCNNMNKDPTVLHLIENGIYAAIIILLYWLGYVILLNWETIIVKVRRYRRNGWMQKGNQKKQS